MTARLLLTVCALLPLSLPAAAAPPADAPLAVEIIRVEERPLTFDITLTGSIAAQDSIELSFPAGGRITDILVEAGDRVTGGHALARIDRVQQQQALVQALAGVEAAQAAQQQADRAATRADELLQRGVGTRAALDGARQALATAQGQLESARTGLRQARRAVLDTVIRAPRSAVVTARWADPGQVVGPAQPIVTLAALTRLEAVFQVPDSPRLDRAAGAVVTLAPLDRPGIELAARVTEIAPLVDPATGSVTVRATVEAPFDATLLGAAVRGTLHMPAGTGIEVPWAALSATGESPAVWRVGPDGRVAIAPVEVERFRTGRVVLRAGVSPGDLVVGEGSQLMFPGRPVVAGTGP